MESHVPSDRYGRAECFCPSCALEVLELNHFRTPVRRRADYKSTHGVSKPEDALDRRRKEVRSALPVQPSVDSAVPKIM